MTAASSSTRQSPSQPQSATPPLGSLSSSTENTTSADSQPIVQEQVKHTNHQVIEQQPFEMATKQVPVVGQVVGTPQHLPPSTSTYYVQTAGVPASNTVNGNQQQFGFSPFMAAPHIIHQQPQQQKLSPAFQPAYTAAAAFVPPSQQFGPSTTTQQKVGSPKRSESILNSMCNRSQRCGVCKGCTNSACGQCNFCHDSPQFGGPGVKKQSCLERRCHRVLENKLQRDAPSFRARRGCGQCEDCRVPNCNACLVCFDRKYFDNRYIPGAMCARKRCNHAVLLDNSTRMRPMMKKRPQAEDSYGGSPKPAKRPSPAEEFRVTTGPPQVVQPQGVNGNGPSALTQRLLQPMIVNGGQPIIQQSPVVNRLADQHPSFPLYRTATHLDFPNGNGVSFQPQPPGAMDPNANRLFQPPLQTSNPNGMCIFQPAAFIPATNPQQNFYFIPQPLQPTAIHSVGKDIKDDTNGALSNEDPYQPPSYNQEGGSVVLQAL